MPKENNGRNGQKPFINIIDLLFILAVIAIAVFIALNVAELFPKDSALTAGDVELTYVITVTDVPEEIAPQILNGQTVYDVNTGKILGTVSSVVPTPYTVKGINQETGEIVANTLEGRCNINITVAATAKEKNNSYQVNGTTVACGISYQFRTATVCLNGTCISLKN